MIRSISFAYLKRKIVYVKKAFCLLWVTTDTLMRRTCWSWNFWKSMGEKRDIKDLINRLIKRYIYCGLLDTEVPQNSKMLISRGFRKHILSHQNMPPKWTEIILKMLFLSYQDDFIIVCSLSVRLLCMRSTGQTARRIVKKFSQNV